MIIIGLKLGLKNDLGLVLIMFYNMIRFIAIRVDIKKRREKHKNRFFLWVLEEWKVDLQGRQLLRGRAHFSLPRSECHQQSIRRHIHRISRYQAQHIFLFFIR